MKKIKKALELFFVSCLATIIATVITAYVVNVHNSTAPKIILASLQQTPLATRDAAPAQDALSIREVRKDKEVEKISEAELNRFIKILARIKHSYVEELEDKELIESAIQGVLSNLDPYSQLLDPTSFEQFRVSAEGDFGGLGVDVSYQDDFLLVTHVHSDSPAQKAGLLDGDQISTIEGQTLAGQDMEFAVTLLRGQPGSPVALTIVRKDEAWPIHVTAVRERIELKSVQMLKAAEPGYAFFRIKQFQSHTADDLRTELVRLKRSVAGAVKGLVLDLRDNPGGLLRGAVAVSDLFLKDKDIVSTRGRIPTAFSDYQSNNLDILKGAPIVVLVNEKSASSSEIVAAALQDNGRAIVIGETTFGKGIVQTVSQLDRQSALKMTTAKYYTPQGRSIHGVGIVPDEIIEADESNKVDELEARAFELLKSMQVVQPHQG